MNKRKLIITLTPILIIVIGIGIKNFFASFAEEPAKKLVVDPVRYVNAIQVNYSDIDTKLKAFGRIMSNRPLSLVAEVGGKLEQGNANLKNASYFSKGDVIYKINNVEASLALKAQKSEFLSVLSGVIPDLKIDYPDNYKMWEKFIEDYDINKNLPELPEIKSPKEKLFLSGRNIFNIYYQIKSVEKRLERYQFVAPFNGMITNVNSEIGSIINPGNAIATIISTDDMEAELLIKKADIKWLKIGAEITLTNADETVKAKISRIGDFVDPNSQTINVYASFTNSEKNKNFIDGAYIEAIIPSTTIAASIKIPRQSLVGEKTVFVVNNGRLALKEVNLLKIDTDSIIVNGLKVNDILVIESLANATENAPVEAVIIK
jgi:membrane fusion protein, multidrug efflux system